ncbi:MAG: peptidoglycan DD-metalloendopeptidase family protein [Candidatus Eremiobacteraeota bacterium]|nr:peptidoglycan DD-metalloendopeptidase family protein [Candidatus Eremiobacteraeota bacterium]
MRRVFTLGLLVLLTAGALARPDEIDSTRQKIHSVHEKIHGAREDLQVANEREKQMSRKLAATQIKLDGARDVLRDIKDRLARAEERLDKIRHKIKITRVHLRRSQLALERRLRQLYIEGDVSYLAVMLQSEDFTDFLNQSEFVERILETDHQLITEVRARKAELDVQKAAARKTVEEMKSLRAQQEVEVAAILKLKKEQNAVFAEYQAHRRKLASQVSELEHSSRELEAKLQRLMDLRDMPNLPRSAGGYIWPVNGPITSGFGYRYHPVTGGTRFHSGLDLGVGWGTPIHAADNGVVAHAGWLGGYGYCVIINHGGGYATLYGHCSSLNVSVGQAVSQGQIIARVGSTGMSTGPHLHFEVRQNGVPVNPLGRL